MEALRDLQCHACASEVYKIMNRIRSERMGYVQTTTTAPTWASTTTTTWASQVEQGDEVDEDLDDREDKEGGLPRKCSYVF